MTSGPDTLRELALAYLSEQCTVIIDAESGLRQREDIIHPTRVGVRRLRSTIRTYAPLFDVEQAAALEQELVWWAGVLGRVRDLDILGDRLARQLEELPPELVVGPIARQIQTEIEVQHNAGWQDLLAALDSERYRALVAELRRWRSDTPFTDKADVPADKVAKYVEKANKKLDQRLAQAMEAYDSGDEEADEFFHSARKAGKRARYAVELALPEWGEKAQKIISERKDLQDVLGEHQDSIVSATFLRDQGVRTGNRSGHNGFTYGLLYAREVVRKDSVGDRLKPFLS
jgi:CHAD domain-containing protein